MPNDDLRVRIEKNESVLFGASNDGLVSRVKRIEEVLEGDGKSFGMNTKVAILWRGHMWVFCTLSGGLGLIVGAAMTVLIQRMMQ